ncbi:signal peptidase II . Aspartic peptidase. MEROPS family A08 [Geoalkalibacter ferrihydriticus]|uniref:Lipoprotein signal peptidase n=1 Tax=Geoalkalibacter ferrihydriticus TaxID=392333 RepID=A0A1G9VQL4_9BACT|nr:signal peptidase II [Geoalkalibacter ferrihydriticus]SDM74468.1 signal peptidase II . Aspartic peptidase. MEROPS family A08 [Geoalkalibacter ferrihydriticus]
MAIKYRILLATLVLVVPLDQLTKIYIDRNFALYESVVVIENFFRITYVRNPGAAFGILADSAMRIPFFISVATLAAIGILWYISRLEPQRRWLPLALALVLAGAVGNLIDRIRLGEVIDFIDVHWYQYHWPAFNVADAAITAGVVMLLIDMWREERQKKTNESSDQRSAQSRK